MRKYKWPAIYLIVVVFLLLMQFTFDRSNAIWPLLALAITLPWSVLTFFFFLGAAHLGDKAGELLLIVIPAAINLCLIYRVSSNRKSETKHR